MNEKNIITITNLKIFQESNPINCDIQEGQITTIFGMNGSGKTLLLKSIFGIFKYRSGEIIKRYNQSDVGILLQSPEDLLYKADILDEAKLIMQNESDALKLLNEIDVEKNQATFTLSDGQKRLIFIFGYLMSRSVLFFDEPFASVDKQTHKIIETKFTEAKTAGKSIIYTSNRRKDCSIADKIIEII